MTNNKSFIKGYIQSYFEAIINLFIFFPYFFSIIPLLKTLFSPWKRIISVESKAHISFNQWASDVLFNLISRGIGFSMRISIILFYILFVFFYLILIPFVLMFMLVSLPFVAIFNLASDNEVEKKNKFKEYFVNQHSLSTETRLMTESWFEMVYNHRFKKHQWWKLKALMKTPPLARDWSLGYTPKLDLYADNLTDPKFQMRIRRHVVARESETSMIEQILSSTNEANALIIGEEGVGRHTIIESFSKKIYEGQINNILAYKRVVKLNMEKILSEFTDPQRRQTFMEELFYEAAISRSAILVIDEFEKFCSTDRNHFDLTSIIEKFAKGDLLQIIGITTPFKYEKYIYNNTKIRNTFARVDVSEITKDKALYILMEKAIDFEIRFNLIIPYETIVQIIDKSNFFITSIPFPEKALQLLDDVCIYTSQKLKQNTVLPEVVGTVITSKTHIPTTLDIEMKEKLLNLENLMNERIVGQYEAIAELASALRRSFLLIGKRKKPIASFLFLGPTGVGKTETAKVLSEVFFGSSEKLIRFDMSLYQNKTDVDKLIGSIEQLNPGLLTNSIRENPYGVLLLDEIEKAHPDLLNIFLTITDEGYFTDGYGQNVDCKNMVIVATSNAGSSYMDEILIKQSLNKASLNSLNSSSIIDYLVEKRAFSPEFLNRFDSVVAYKPLQKEKAEDLAKLMIASLSDTIFQMYKVKINVSENTLKQLTNQGYDVQYGARNLQRILRQKVEDTIAKLLLEGKAKEGDTISL